MLVAGGCAADITTIGGASAFDVDSISSWTAWARGSAIYHIFSNRNEV